MHQTVRHRLTRAGWRRPAQPGRLDTAARGSYLIPGFVPSSDQSHKPRRPENGKPSEPGVDMRASTRRLSMRETFAMKWSAGCALLNDDWLALGVRVLRVCRSAESRLSAL